ncbi:MAG: hypothetical protein A6F72_05530 [Cycloclasticus sp. symbiont of Poecilosclerida sp. N]|nr:MAG: hypothetical protein A6F72_05530 [Cycloclasticus sp. symbiont of Poecilosclerida sp. N]
MKLIVVIVTLLTLSACAGLSMYNQEPAPIGGAGEAINHPSKGVKTYPLDEHPTQESLMHEYSPQRIETLRNQNPAVLALLGSAHQQSESGQLDLAASKLERALRIAPRDAQVWFALAKVRYQQGKYLLAISLTKKSNLLSRRNTSLQRNNWLLMADSYDRLGNVNAARKARAKVDRLL